MWYVNPDVHTFDIRSLVFSFPSPSAFAQMWQKAESDNSSPWIQLHLSTQVGWNAICTNERFWKVKAFGWCGLSEKVVQPKTFQPDRLLRLCITVILRVKWQKVLFKCWHRSIQCIVSMIHAQPCLCTCTTLLCAATPHLPLHSMAITSQINWERDLRLSTTIVLFQCLLLMYTLGVALYISPCLFKLTAL